jgi:hypothetical protein
MKKLARVSFAAALLALVSAPLAGCQSCEGQARFWSVNGGSAFTVDTAAVPLTSGKINLEYVDAQGRRVRVDDAAVSQISEAQYVSGTSGAGYSIAYCGVMKACWAIPSPK